MASGILASILADPARRATLRQQHAPDHVPPQCQLTDFDAQCTEPAAARYAAMCVHEHRHTGLFCAIHEPLALDGGWCCNDCREPVHVAVIEDFRTVSGG